jgi:hypothetical protein
MKIPAYLLIALLLALPLRAQNAPSDTIPSAGPADATTSPDIGNVTPQSAAPAPRNIMPMSINHKPNATNPPPEIAGPIDKFFKGLKQGDYSGSYETFLAGTRLGAQKEKMSVFVSKTQEAFALYGKLNDYEVFDNYSIGSNVVVLTYLSRHEIQPLRWRFIFYRADKSWGLINMGFDDVLLDMLD